MVFINVKQCEEMAHQFKHSIAKNSCRQFNTGLKVIFDPKYMGLETGIVHLSVEMADI